MAVLRPDDAGDNVVIAVAGQQHWFSWRDGSVSDTFNLPLSPSR
jgi:hypothetical protein